MSYKYLILINSAYKENIVKEVKNIANGYWITCSNSVCLINLDQQMEPDALRDKIRKDSPDGSVCVIEMFTTGNAAANGIYSKEDTWDWIKDFTTNDEKKIRADAVTLYKKTIESKIIPNAEVRITDTGIGI